ncbi:MAG: SIR2 family protein [Fusobacterium sp.]
MSYIEYKKSIILDIKKTLETMKSQPILFVGSGFSKRYFNAPDWMELLSKIKNMCPLIDKDFNYFQQKYNYNGIKIADEFINPIYEWAWSSGKQSFPKEIFNGKYNKNIYLKTLTAYYIKNLVPDSLNKINEKKLKNELNALQKIIPHAIITTNYDNFLEKTLFPDYFPVIGQQILRNSYANIGEILKIHGCSSKPSSLVLVEEDYKEFAIKKKYLSAKLFTYFIEHPLVFIGYSASDPNIKSILSDIHELLSKKGEVVSNIYIITWQNNIKENDYFEQIKTISLENNNEIKIKNIIASEFSWIFKTFSYRSNINNINIKTLRALMARVHKLVRTDIPNSAVKVNYQTLESAIESDKGIPKLLGITPLDSSTAVNANYPYTLTNLATKLGYTNWYPANQFIKKIAEEKNINIKSFDNVYHINIKTGKNNSIHKYSEKCFLLLKKVKEKKRYNLERT